jgi:hypothetical protein
MNQYIPLLTSAVNGVGKVDVRPLWMPVKEIARRISPGIVFHRLSTLMVVSRQPSHRGVNCEAGCQRYDQPPSSHSIHCRAQLPTERKKNRKESSYRLGAIRFGRIRARPFAAFEENSIVKDRVLRFGLRPKLVPSRKESAHKMSV